MGTEHILLGLIREGEGVAAQVLTALGADLGQVRQRVMELLGGGFYASGNAHAQAVEDELLDADELGCTGEKVWLFLLKP